MPDLSTASDAELLDGSCGVFASNWIDSDQEPQATGNYLVVVRSYEPVIALYMKELGWDLSNTMHIGLEGKITHWMVLPEGPRRER
jgi:hypothetical protein